MKKTIVMIVVIIAISGFWGWFAGHSRGYDKGYDDALTYCDGKLKTINAGLLKLDSLKKEYITQINILDSLIKEQK